MTDIETPKAKKTLIGALLAVGAALLKVVAGALIIPLTMLWHGFVFAQLWEWFVQPICHVHISTYLGFGIMLTIRFLVKPYDPNAASYAWAKAITAPLIPFVVGSIWHWLQWGM